MFFSTVFEEENNEYLLSPVPLYTSIWYPLHERETELKQLRRGKRNLPTENTPIWIENLVIEVL